MVRRAGNGNPFRPGTGRMPPLLAGRDTELAAAERRLADLASGYVPSQGLFFYGPRGNGKTALLRHIASRCREHGLRAEELSGDALLDRGMLLAALQQRAGAAGRRLTGVQVGPLGATTQAPVPTTDAFALLSGWVDASPAPLVLLMDEIQTIDPVAGRVLFGAIQRGAGEDQPLLLVAAGTPGAPSRLRQCGTFMERAFERYRIGRLAGEAANRALAEPAETAGRPMSSGAQERLREESQHYPYFIQLLGSAAWDAAAAAGEEGISANAARAGMDAARLHIAEFYGQRLLEAEERGLADILGPVASLFAERGPQVRDSALRDPLEELAQGAGGSGTWTSLRTALLELGIVWEASPGMWEIGIPSFARYILDRAASG